MLTYGVLGLVSFLFYLIASQLWPTVAFHMKLKAGSETKRAWQNAQVFFAFIISVGVAIFMPLLSVGAYGILMGDVTYFANCLTLLGIVWPNDFVNIYIVCLGVLFYMMVYFWAFWTLDKTRVMLRVYTSAMCTIMLIPMVDSFAAGFFDVIEQETIPFSMSFIAIMNGFLLLFTALANAFAGATTKESDFDRIAREGTSNDVCNFYSYGVAYLTRYTKYFNIMGIDIGYIQPIARVLSLSFSQLCRYNDMIKFNGAFLLFDFFPLIFSALMGQQFYLITEGSMQMFGYGNSFFSTAYIQNGTDTLVGLTPFINTNTFTVPGTQGPYLRLGLFNSLPAFFELLGIMSLIANTVALLVASAKVVLRSDRTFSSSLLAKSVEEKEY